jgi:UV DNA damage endonuclease
MIINKLGTVCMTGTFSNGEFKHALNTNMGTVTRKAMLQICNIDSPELLTVELVNQYLPRLKAKLLPKIKQNLNALYNQLLFVSAMPDTCKMLRISSNLLPLFDHPVLSHIYDTELLSLISVTLARCKRVIDQHNIAVSTHPDQYVIINSVSEGVRQSAYNTLHYHKFFMAQLTTASQTSINIHLEGNLDHLPEIDAGLHLDLIPWLSFENSDKNGKVFTGDLYNTLIVCEKYNIKCLYDLHHHTVMTGVHLSVTDPLFSRIIATWGGSTPIFHVSQSRETESVVRAHSDFITEDCIVKQVADLLFYGHVEVEAKAKTSAVLGLYQLVQKHLYYEE